VTVLRAVCSPDVKSFPRDIPYGLIMWAAAILTVFGILIALFDGWAP
jgi:hypothetical protein